MRNPASPMRIMQKRDFNTIQGNDYS